MNYTLFNLNDKPKGKIMSQPKPISIFEINRLIDWTNEAPKINVRALSIKAFLTGIKAGQAGATYEEIIDAIENINS